MKATWQNLLVELNDLKLKLKSDSPIAFNFVEGIRNTIQQSRICLAELMLFKTCWLLVELKLTY